MGESGQHRKELLEEVRLLTIRSFHCSMRGEFMSVVKLAEVVLVAFLAGTVWMQTEIAEDSVFSSAGCLFFMVSYWFFSAVFAATLSCYTERLAVEREFRAGMYRLSSYVIGKAIGSIPSRVFLPSAFVIICYFISFAPSAYSTGDGVGSVLAMIFVIIFTICACDGLGMLLGNLFYELNTSMSVTNGLGMCTLLFGGFYASAEWSGVSWLKEFSLVRYAYDACATLQFEEQSTYECESGKLFVKCIPQPNNPDPTVSSAEVMSLLGVDTYTVGQNIGAVVLFAVIMYSLAYAVMLYKFSKTW
jgi:hypothetical protein